MPQVDRFNETDVVFLYSVNLPPSRQLSNPLCEFSLAIHKNQHLGVPSDDPFQTNLSRIEGHILEDIDPTRQVEDPLRHRVLSHRNHRIRPSLKVHSPLYVATCSPPKILKASLNIGQDPSGLFFPI